MDRPRRGTTEVNYKDPRINQKDRDGYARTSNPTHLDDLIAVGNWPRDKVDLALRRHNNDKEKATKWLLEQQDYRAQTQSDEEEALSDIREDFDRLKEEVATSSNKEDCLDESFATSERG